MAETYVEVLTDGLTIGGAVRRAGDCVALEKGFEPQSKKDQVERWGEPRYRKITQKEFEERGGQRGEVLGFNPEAPAEPVEAPESPPGEFAEFGDLNVEDTLSRVASLDDEAVARFILWEQGNDNRKGVLEPLGAWTE